MKKSSLKMFLAFKNGVKSIQTAGYNGALTINAFYKPNQTPWYVCLIEGWPHMELLCQP